MKPFACSRGINVMICAAWLTLASRIWLTGSNAALPQFTPPPVIG